jgi:hypothetical protein
VDGLGGAPSDAAVVVDVVVKVVVVDVVVVVEQLVLVRHPIHGRGHCLELIL